MGGQANLCRACELDHTGQDINGGKDRANDGVLKDATEEWFYGKGGVQIVPAHPSHTMP